MVERYYNELWGFLRGQLHDGDAAGDLAQEAYARALGAQAAGREPRDFRSLLYRIARNLIVDRHRRASVRQHTDIDAVHDLSAPAAAQPENAAAAQQQVAAMLAVIDALPPRCREAFVLHKFEQLPHAEVAARMGISRNAVEKHIIRALLACRACDDRYNRP
ncbi:RNA polymerase sigma factor [Luteibacter yeojuensis]|uniref:RNA polymerase sigma factor n=1 Tax=Luteibacter yeojuensis TaxID=345309 RepID=A0A0F3KUB3_9GAMM|nr:RNA polymerase sigma factor [Luteibacter yeojuensis]KJV34751.1 RNA polymerase sigma factor [Luteibacter yeojuensis]